MIKKSNARQLVKDPQQILELLSSKNFAFADLYKKFGVGGIDLAVACVQEGLPDLLARLAEKNVSFDFFPIREIANSIEDFTADEQKKQAYRACFEILK